MNGPTRISTAYISHGGGPLPLLEIQSQEGEKAKSLSHGND